MDNGYVISCAPRKNDYSRKITVIVYNLKEKETYIEQVKYADESGKTKIGYNVYTLFALPKKTYKEIVKNTIEENKASANPNAAKVLEELEKELLSEE